MPRDDPFKGIPLSGQAGKLDQRLFSFTPEPSHPPEAKPVPIEESKPETAKPIPPTPSAQSDTPTTVTKSTKPTHTATYDLGDDPRYKASFVFTQPELEALEDLKLDLRRELDQKVTKNDLIRSALHLLLEDHQSNGTKSYVTRKIRRRGD